MSYCIFATLYIFLCKHDRRTPPSPDDHKYSSSALKTNNLIKAECVNYSGGRKRCPLAADASDNTRRACRIPACGPDREFIYMYWTMLVRPGSFPYLTSGRFSASHKTHRPAFVRRGATRWMDWCWMATLHARRTEYACWCSVRTATHTCPYTAITLSVYILIELAPRKLTVKTCDRFQKLYYGMVMNACTCVCVAKQYDGNNIFHILYNVDAYCKPQVKAAWIIK